MGLPGPRRAAGRWRRAAAAADHQDVEEARRDREELFAGLLRTVPVGIIRTDATGALLWANPRWEEITGRTLAEEIGRDLFELVDASDRDRIEGLRHLAPASEELFARYRITTPDGELRWVATRSVALRGADGVITGYVGSYEDVTAAIEAGEATARLANIAESTIDMVGVINADGTFAYLNQAGREFYGLANAGPIAVRAGELLTPVERKRLAVEVLPELRAGRAWSGELEVQRPDGSVAHVWQTISPELGPDGDLKRFSAVGRDVSAQKRVEAELAHRATHDPLTELPNRVLLLDRLDLAIKQTHRSGASIALLFIDLDGFKAVNDRHGHEAGDLLLRQVAGRLQSVVRPFDTVARLGGDEFVVLCADMTDQMLASVMAARLLDAIEGVPFVIGATEQRITASIGIAVSSTSEDHAEGMLREADAAMYRAKAQGRARYELFDEAMRIRSQHRQEVIEELRTGLDRDALCLHYQAIVTLPSGRITGLEAFARWQHPQRGLVHPDGFIAVAEETGLIVPLGAALIEQGCRQLREWQDAHGTAAPRLHLNISPRQLAAPDLVSLVSTTLDRTGADPALLCLELTEMALMGNEASAGAVLGALKELGLTIAIDDFGIGSSSIAHLHRFPIDVVKIDGSFVEGLSPDPEDCAIVAALVRLAHTLGLEAIAEGVETEGQLERLRALDCDQAQGFLFARPASAVEVSDLLRLVEPFAALVELS